MKRIQTAVVAVLITGVAILISSCKFKCETASGHEVTETRTLNEFTKVETSGSVKLILKQDSVQSVKIIADENVMNNLTTTVHGKTLSIKLDGNFCDSGPITVYLNAKNFEGVDASGSVEVVSDGRINTTNFDLDLSGAGNVDLDLSANELNTHLSGSTNVKLRGQAAIHKIDMSGSSEVKAFDFVVANYEIESSGSSACFINVLTSLNVNSSGSSDIQYKGNPSRVKNDDSGASSVKKVE